MSKMTTNFDDWETDPDFVRDMDEIDQRWGNKRTVGSINMNELIDEVRRDHKSMRDKNQHSSQRDYSGGFCRGDLTAGPGHGSQEHISRRVITTSSESSYVRETNNGQVNDAAKRSIIEKSTDIQKSQRVPPLAPKPSSLTSRLTPETASGARQPPVSSPRPTPSSTRTEQVETKWDNSVPYNRLRTEPPKQFTGSSVTKRIFEEELKSSSLLNSPREKFTPESPRRAGSSATQSQAFKSIQDKIDAFKKEFENIESKVAKKSDLSRVIKKTTNVEKQQANNSMQYVSRSSTEKLGGSQGDGYLRPNTTSPPMTRPLLSERPTSTSPLHQAAAGDTTQPKASIKSLSERFESMGRETSDDFRKRMEERRREFFDKIKTQVRETRKGLDGFDMIDSDDDDTRIIIDPPERHNYSTSPTGIKQDASRPCGSQSPFSRPSSRISSGGSQLSSSGKPKVYSKRETTEEQIISRFVKENDKVIHDETKRNVERSSSCHGSSEDEIDQQPSSIKFIDKELRSPPLEQRTQSPIDEIKRKIPVVEPSNKGAGLMARTLYDYQAVERDELTFDVDDLITNIEKIDQGWYKGTITKGDRKQVGLFPANYVKLLNDSDEY